MGAARRFSTPVVLAAASAMVSVGMLAVFSRRPARPPGGSQDVLVSQESPQAAAETFLDAWRKRAHRVALRVSTGRARDEVLSRRKADQALSPDERAVKGEVWDALARTRLSFEVDAEQELAGGGRLLEGRAVGLFMNRPYAREVGFVVMQSTDGAWVVEQMSLGAQLSEAPDFLSEEVEPANPQ